MCYMRLYFVSDSLTLKGVFFCGTMRIHAWPLFYTCYQNSHNVFAIFFFRFRLYWVSNQSKDILRHSVTLCQMKLIFDEHELGKRVLLLMCFFLLCIFKAKKYTRPDPLIEVIQPYFLWLLIIIIILLHTSISIS